MSTGKKRKRFYGGSHLHSKKFKGLLGPGYRGFICTCNERSKECLREACNLLDEYAEKLYPQLLENDDNEDDVEKQLDSLKSASRSEARFQILDTGANNCLFIKTTVEDPVKLVTNIMSDIQTNKQAKSRFLIRLLPIMITSKAFLDDIKKAASAIFDETFKGDPTTFSIVYNHRHNNSLLREELLGALAALVKDKNPNHRVDLKSPAKTVLVEVIKNVCCLSVVDKFLEFKKYNLIELSKDSGGGCCDPQ